jgi:TonB family protein
MYLAVVNTRPVAKKGFSAPVVATPENSIRAISAPRRSERPLFWASACSALAIHGVVVLWFALGPAPQAVSGAGGYRLEAINVMIVPSAVLDARELKANDAQSAADVPSRTEDKPSPENVEKAEENVPVASAEILQRSSEKASSQKKVENIQSGPSGASPGIIERYAAQVRAALARKKLNGQGSRGTATITFGISVAGSVRFARLSDSSGRSALDQIALDVVLRTSFPVPPERMTEEQLTYVVPFHFK